MNAASSQSSTGASSAQTIDLQDDRNVERWLDELGVTREQLTEAVQAVGPDAAKVREHLLHQGASAGAS